jgi:hypothetical protein
MVMPVLMSVEPDLTPAQNLVQQNADSKVVLG